MVSHVSVLQCLLSYFRGSPVEECTNIAFPMDTVVELTPVQGGSWKETRYGLIPRSRANSKERGAQDAQGFFGAGEGREWRDESVHAGSEFSYLEGEWEGFSIFGV